jgi:hypothetical protein
LRKQTANESIGEGKYSGSTTGKIGFFLNYTDKALVFSLV